MSRELIAGLVIGYTMQGIDLTIILLLCGGDKDTQEGDIEQAKQFWNDFKQREHADE